jgi:hypothetical protein
MANDIRGQTNLSSKEGFAESLQTTHERESPRGSLKPDRSIRDRVILETKRSECLKATPWALLSAF